MEDKILIDRETLKAIAVDTRINIIKLLSNKNYTLSDISDMLGMSVSTIKEHLDILVKAKLIKKEKTERKWKYYSLTFKGKRLIEPREIKVLFAFITTLIAAVGMAFVFAKSFLMKGAQTFAAEVPRTLNVMEAAKDAGIGGAELTSVAKGAVITGTEIAPYNLSIIMFIILLILIVLSAFFFGMLLKKPQLIITKGGNKK
jgi:DNA-binding transcriptional ArsR family regulator